MLILKAFPAVVIPLILSVFVSLAGPGGVIEVGDVVQSASGATDVSDRSGGEAGCFLTVLRDGADSYLVFQEDVADADTLGGICFQTFDGPEAVTSLVPGKSGDEPSLALAPSGVPTSSEGADASEPPPSDSSSSGSSSDSTGSSGEPPASTSSPPPPPPPPPTTVSFAANADATVREIVPSKNFGTSTFMTAKSKSGDHRRAFVGIDISSIPAGSTVSSATLTLCVVESSGDGQIGSTDEVRRVTAAWGETTITWNNQASVSSTVTGTITVPGTSCVNVDVTSDVQAWVSGVANNGWRVSNQDAGFGSVDYGTRENSSPSSRPHLEVTYTSP